MAVFLPSPKQMKPSSLSVAWHVSSKPQEPEMPHPFNSPLHVEAVSPKTSVQYLLMCSSIKSLKADTSNCVSMAYSWLMARFSSVKSSKMLPTCKPMGIGLNVEVAQESKLVGLLPLLMMVMEDSPFSAEFLALSSLAWHSFMSSFRHALAESLMPKAPPPPPTQPGGRQLILIIILINLINFKTFLIVTLPPTDGNEIPL